MFNNPPILRFQSRAKIKAASRTKKEDRLALFFLSFLPVGLADFIIAGNLSKRAPTGQQ